MENVLHERHVDVVSESERNGVVEVTEEDIARLLYPRKNVTIGEKRAISKTIQWIRENPQVKIHLHDNIWANPLIEAIDDALSEVYDTTLEIVMEHRRERWRVDIRTYVFHIIRQRTKYPLVYLGKMFGYNHTTISHLLNSFHNLCDTDENYKNSYLRLMESVNKNLI